MLQEILNARGRHNIINMKWDESKVHSVFSGKMCKELKKTKTDSFFLNNE